VNKKSMLLAAAGVALVGVGLASSATADPLTTGRILNGVGSDTTQDLMNGFSKLTAGSNIASWDATGSSTFDTGNAGCTAVARSNGSGAGRTALVNDTAGCINFARSSSFSTVATLSGYPAAIDGLTYAVTQNSSVPKSLTKDEIKAIYSCSNDTAGIVPVLPQTGSGSRNDWLSHVFGASTFPPVGVTVTCYLGAGTDNALQPQEHDGRQLTSTQVVPYSVAKWISQMTAVISDVRGKAVIPLYDTTGAAADGNMATAGVTPTSPVQLNTAGAFTRVVYNYIKRADAVAITTSNGVDTIAGTADDDNTQLTAVQAALKGAFVGSTSVVCSNDRTIINNGFAPIPAGSAYLCGVRRDS